MIKNEIDEIIRGNGKIPLPEKCIMILSENLFQDTKIEATKFNKLKELFIMKAERSYAENETKVCNACSDVHAWNEPKDLIPNWYLKYSKLEEFI